MLSTHQTSRSTVFRLSPLWIITLVWAASLLLLVLLQAFNSGLGFHVRPQAEDRECIRLLQKYPGLEMVRQFWETLEKRNPLAPWWYQAFTPLIFLMPEGLYLLRKLVDLFMAISVYLLVGQISRARIPKFALGCGVLVLFWNFSGYQEQILWLTLVSFGLSILSVWFYCLYLDSARAAADYIVISLLLFFVALATYSIQCGVPIAVFLLGLFRRQKTTGGWRLSSAACGAIKDTFFFGVLFVLFIQIWMTTSVPLENDFRLNPGQVWKQFQTSISNFVWHTDTSFMANSLRQHWPLWLIAASMGVGATLFYILFAATGRQEGSPNTAGSSVLLWDLVLVLAVFCALVAPTVLLESTTETWAPGSRSRMVQQGFQPVLYLSILFLLTEYLSQWTRRGIEYVRNWGIALLCALAVVIGLEYNGKLIQQSMFDHKLETGLKKIQPAIGRPTHFVVKMKGIRLGDWYSGAAWTMPSLFVETAYNSDAVWLDPVYQGDPGASKLVVFGNDQQGIYSPESRDWIPYRDVVFVEFDGKRVTRLTSIDRETFAGYGARYTRQTPLVARF